MDTEGAARGVKILIFTDSQVNAARHLHVYRDDLVSKWRLLLVENELSRVSLLSRISIGF